MRNAKLPISNVYNKRKIITWEKKYTASSCFVATINNN